MWRRVALEADIRHPPAAVFSWLADPERWSEFAPAVESRRRIGHGVVDVGSRWEAVDRIGPFRIRFTDELVVLEPDERVVWDSSAPWNSRVEYRLTVVPGGTRVEARYEGDVAGWLRLAALLPTWVLRLILMRDFHGLRRQLAAEGGVQIEDQVELTPGT
jgi:carbon monoxide dehydrogenase subunit G